MTKYLLQVQCAQIQKYNKIYFLESYVIVVRSVSWFTWDGLHKQILLIPGCSMFAELVSTFSDSQRTLSWYIPSCNQCWHFKSLVDKIEYSTQVNPLNPELNPICYLLALLGAHHFLHVSRIRVKLLTFRLLMSYRYGAPILDVSRSHTTTQHSR